MYKIIYKYLINIKNMANFNYYYDNNQNYHNNNMTNTNNNMTNTNTNMTNTNNNNNTNINTNTNINNFIISIEELIENGTINLIVQKINQIFQNINENNYRFYNLVLLMSLIDKRYHFDETVAEYNHRIRQSIANNYNTVDLSSNKLEYFRIWERAVSLLPENASRIDLFNAAPIDALYIVGL